MSFLDVFAIIILFILGVTGIGLWVALGIFPGKIARKRRHPQADAISVCGWWGALTLGLLAPIAFIWAYTNPRWQQSENDSLPCKDDEDTAGR